MTANGTPTSYTLRMTRGPKRLAGRSWLILSIRKTAKFVRVFDVYRDDVDWVGSTRYKSYRVLPKCVVP